MNKHTVESIIFALMGQLQEEGWENDPNLKDTPRRVAEMYAEMLGGHDFDFTTSPNEGEYTYDQIIVLSDIPFTSMCMHHLTPFFGHASIAYIPDKLIAGLSKLARTVEHSARKLQLQETLTQEIGEFLNNTLHPVGVAVIIDAEHLCIRGRGIRKPGVMTTTSYLRGAFLDKLAAREELMFLLKRGS